MTREIGVYLAKLAVFSLALFLVHYAVLSQVFAGRLYFPLWTIYSFQATMVLLLFVTLRYYVHKKPGESFKLFLGLTTVKMVLSILFLLPLFLKKSEHTQLEVLNFFIPYFLFLIFEIIGLNNLLKES